MYHEHDMLLLFKLATIKYVTEDRVQKKIKIDISEKVCFHVYEATAAAMKKKLYCYDYDDGERR